MQILLVEDNTVNQILAERLVRKRGHIVVIANNGREALAALDRERFDLILMDVQMPEMSGLEATAAIRQKERETGAHIPIIAMTAYAMKEDRDRCLDAGMDAYVSKPIDKKALFEAIERLTGVSEGEQTSDTGKSQDMVFDAAKVLEHLGGDSDLLHEITGIFLAQCPKHMAKIREAVANRDPKGIEYSAHALKGSAANLFARQSVEAALKLEDMGRAGSVVGAEEAFARLEQEIGKLQQILAAFDKEHVRSEA